MNYFNMAFDALRLFPEFRAKMLQGFENEVKIWAEVIKKARERGEIKSTMSDEEIAQTYVYLGDGVALHKIMTGSVSMDKLVPILFLWDKIYEQIKV